MWDFLCSHILLCCYIFSQDLNSYLEDKVYMAGNKITLADILTYYGLHPIIVSIFQ